MNVWTVRQFLLLIAIFALSLVSGIQLAFPSVLNTALLEPNATVKATSEEASWIAVSLGIGGHVSYCFVPIIFDVYGRKMANLASNFFMIAGSLIFWVANDVYMLALARFVQGLAYGAGFTCVITLCECVPPKRRGYFMVINKISIGVGSLVCHTLGLVLNWRQIAVSSALVNCLSVFLLIITEESPAYYAKRGEFEKCERAFKWYRGDSFNVNNELKELVLAQTENIRLKQRKKNISIFKKTKKKLLSKDFLKSFYIVTLATLCIDSCGRVILFAYITQILIEITNNKTLSMYMSVVSDGILLCALCVSTILVKFYNRRTLLFRLGFCSAFCMFLVSVMIILRNNFSFLQDIKWLIPTVLFIHNFVTNIGLVPIAFALMGEVFSLDHRGLGVIASGFMYLFFFNVVLKITPAMMENTGVEGTYSIYGTCLVIFLLLLRMVLPETKDKTLQAIEDEIKGIVRKNSDVELMDVNSK